MRFNKKDYIKLENALIKAYREKERPRAKASEQWEMSLMQHIRRLGELPFKPSPLELFERLGWRLAPAVCILIAVLSFWMVKVDFIPDDEMTKFSMEHPIEASYVDMSGL